MDKDSVSLARLLDQIEKCADQITWDAYLLRFPREPQGVDWQSTAFGHLSKDKLVVSAELVHQDLDELWRLTETIERFADKVLAHLDRRGFEEKVTFDSMHAAIGHFDELVCRYNTFFAGNGYQTLEAVVQYRWEQIFSVPLKAPA